MRKILFAVIVALPLLVCGSASAQQTFDARKMDGLFDVLESNNKMMGVVTITRDGKTVYNRALGYSRVSGAEKVRNSGATKFRIASLTKTFTAVMIFQLIDEKRLTLETKLSKFFPQIANADRITIEQMLVHRSGIHNFSLDEDYQEWKIKPHTKKEILARFAAYKPEFNPNEKEVYSNTAYVLLGYVIESLTNSTYGEQLNKRIVKKIGLKNTFVGGDINPSNGEALPYTFADGKWNQVAKSTDLSNSAGAGAIVSSTSDINLFLAALFDKKLISEESLQSMTTPPVVTGDDTAKGVARMAFNNRTKIGFTYDGSIDAFGSVYFYVPSDRLGVAITTNGENYPSGEIFWLVMRILYGAPASIPSFTPVTLPDEKLSKYEGTYTLTATDLKVTIKKANSKIVAQMTGEPPMTLEATSETKFQFEPDGVLVEFQSNEAGEVNRVSIYKDRQKSFWVKAR
ncbi:MAG TPA: serine hydrolase domain-containing protein [Pyrinomonadaceae bacterium]|jgi:CubicO group peptidase (beta-lactamase class C family)|nr:serine hydrolase domain-containing protein [Pyrinomonadaceae bacterium]